MPQAYGGQTVTDSAQILPGVIVDSDINAAAAIAYSKLLLTLGIVDGDISGSAAIVDTKLAQIVTAAKVSGAALTSLSSVPAGAGQLPSVNMSSVGTVHSNGVTTKQGSDGSTTQTIAHGLGVAPSKVRFTMFQMEGAAGNITYGSWDATSQNCIWGNHNSAGAGQGSTVGRGLDMTATGGGANLYQLGSVTVDATNITITWTQSNGGDVGERVILWEAIV